MLQPLIFCDLAGTLEVRDPRTGMACVWPDVRVALGGLVRDHELHLTTGDSRTGARLSLSEFGLSDLFTELHAGLPGGGKPFGGLAQLCGRPTSRCLAIGDNPVSDTAGDTDEVVSVIVVHTPRIVPAARVAAVVRALGAGGSFLAGFNLALAAATDAEAPGASAVQAARWSELPRSDLVGECRLGWWNKPGAGARPVVVLGH